MAVWSHFSLGSPDSCLPCLIVKSALAFDMVPECYGALTLYLEQLLPDQIDRFQLTA